MGRHRAKAENHAEAASIIAEARAGNRILDMLPDHCRPMDEAEGYKVQQAVHGALSEHDWGAIAGYKIGCTTAVMQANLGLTSPCGGAFSRAVSIMKPPISPSGIMFASAPK